MCCWIMRHNKIKMRKISKLCRFVPPKEVSIFPPCCCPDCLLISCNMYTKHKADTAKNIIEIISSIMVFNVVFRLEPTILKEFYCKTFFIFSSFFRNFAEHFTQIKFFFTLRCRCFVVCCSEEICKVYTYT